MSGNEAFEMVNERGWRRGLGNMLDSEFARWWKTKMWWIQAIIWMSAIGFFLIATSVSPEGFNLNTGVTLYSIFGGMFPAVGVVIIMQDVLVGEKSEGTAAWVLSKPVSRPAFILSKLAANSLGVLVTMVVLPGFLAYGVFSFFSKSLLDPIHFLAAIGIIFLSNFFFLTFTLMLGTLFKARGPVIGLALALVFLQQYIVGLLPFTVYMLPWTLTVPLNNEADTIVPSLLLGLPVTSYLPLLGVALESVLFIVICLWRFNKEEF